MTTAMCLPLIICRRSLWDAGSMIPESGSLRPCLLPSTRCEKLEGHGQTFTASTLFGVAI